MPGPAPECRFVRLSDHETCADRAVPIDQPLGVADDPGCPIRLNVDRDVAFFAAQRPHDVRSVVALGRICLVSTPTPSVRRSLRSLPGATYLVEVRTRLRGESAVTRVPVPLHRNRVAPHRPSEPTSRSSGRQADGGSVRIRPRGIPGHTVPGARKFWRLHPFSDLGLAPKLIRFRTGPQGRKMEATTPRAR